MANVDGDMILAQAKSFTRQTVEGMGAIKGKNCTISKIEYDEDGNTVVTFAYTLDDGTKVEKLGTIKKGEDGVSITSFEVNEDDETFIVNFSDGTKSDPQPMLKEKIAISKESGNVLEKKEDGLYVGATGVEISKEEDNAIETKEDGLYVKKTSDVKISEKEKNILTSEEDGLYVPETDLSEYTKTEDFDELAEKVAEIELFKFPNAVIHGTPNINNGQVSDFSNANYLVFPSVFNLSGRGFEFKFAFTTKDDITAPQNILGGKFCMALFIQNGKLNLRVSSNGTSWDIVNLEGSTTIEANKTYYVKINFTRLNYVLSLSTDDETYNEIGSANVGDISPFPAEIYIGVGNNFNNPFKGIINLNKCYLKVNQSIIWQGMDDAGLATRLATDLDNIDAEGIEAIKTIASEEFVSKNQGAENKGKVLGIGEDGKVKPVAGGAGGGDAEDITYENESYPTWTNVKKALDGIMAKVDYVKPSIKTFTATPATTVYEIGQKIASIVFNWTVNKDITSQTLTGCTLVDENVRTATYDQELSSNKTFTLKVDDGQNTDSKSFSVAFQNRIYYGSAALPESFDSDFILGLSDKKFATAKAGTYNVNVAASQYAFIAYPKSFGQITSAKIGGFDTDLENCGDIEFTNASGHKSTYNIVRTGRSGLGSISMVVS